VSKKKLVGEHAELIPFFEGIVQWTLKNSLATSEEKQNIKDSAERIAKGYTEMVWSHSRIVSELKDQFSKRFPRNAKSYVSVPIIEGPIQTSSVCPHHLLPILNTVHYGYIADSDNVIGLSKFVRIAEILARRAVIQEQYTVDLATILEHGMYAGEQIGEPLSNSVAVHVKAKHLCMMCRGVRSQSETTSVAFSGKFEHPHNVGIFMNSVKNGY